MNSARSIVWTIGSLIAVGVVVAPGCQWSSAGQNASGVKLYQQGQFQQALAPFQQAVSNDPTNPASYYNLGSTYHKIAKQSGRVEDFKLAESNFQQALGRDPNYIDARRAYAVLLIDQKRPGEAVTMLETWSQQSPMLSAPKVELARLAQENGARDKAKTYLIDAININPNDARALAALGRMQEEDGNREQALANYQRSLDRNRIQPELTARVDALRAELTRSTVPGAPTAPTTTPGGTRTVVNPVPTIR